MNIYGEPAQYWSGNLVPDVLYQQTQAITPQFQVPLMDPRFILECPDEEVWIPSDQTIHWGKRPNYIYPALKLVSREDLSSQHIPLNVPRGSRLVAKLWFSEWSWDEPSSSSSSNNNSEDSSSALHKMQRPDPAACSCFEDEKTMVPFEKGLAIFRHLRIAKNIKLKKTETFTITALGFEMGYHNPFTKTPFKSLEIFVSKPVKIHVVAHKGSVKLMQKHGLLPQSTPETPRLPAIVNSNNSNSNPNLSNFAKLPPVPSQPYVPATSSSSQTSRELGMREQSATTSRRNTSSSSESSANSALQPGSMGSGAAPTDNVMNALNNAMSTLEEATTLISTINNTTTSTGNTTNNTSSTNTHSNANATNAITSTRTTGGVVPNNNNSNATASIVPISNKRNWSQVMAPPSTSSDSGPAFTSAELETQKRIKANQMGEIIDELSLVQQQLDSLKRRIYEFMTTPNPSPAPKIVSKLFRIACSGERVKMNAFVFYAFRTKNLELGVSLIKTFGFDINERNSLGYTLLHVSAKHQFQEGVHWCLQRGADVNAITHLHDTPLHFAYLRNDKSIRKVLKEAGADRDAVNVYGLKPKDYKNNRKPIIKPFSESLFSVEVTIEGFDKPFFVEIWFAARIGWLEVVRLYIEQLNCDVDIKNTNGQTPLMCATEHRQEECVRYLLQMGADPNARDIHDSTALHYAYTNYEQCKSVVEMLEKHGADATVKNIFNRTPLFYKNKNLDSHWNTVWNL